MIEVRRTEAFTDWIAALRDRSARSVIARRLDRMARGLAGDVRPVGAGVSELRVNYGPGYRVYFVKRGDIFILLLCGGDKSSQSRDIARALEMAKEV